ncbi:hypothetical protein N9D97_03890 [Planktomarina temperata]|nr:hypothetical protein [Planktomarina temperata]
MRFAVVHKQTDDSLALINQRGLSKIYDPLTGAACGGVEFTWTAAMVIEFVSQSENA